MVTHRIILAMVAGVLLSGCAEALGSPTALPSPTTPLPSSSATPIPTLAQQTATAAPTLSLTQRCTNDNDGFSVSYPADWYTNDAADINGDHVAACTVFAPFVDFEVLPEAINVPILLHHESGPLPDDGTPLTIDGRAAVVVETDVDGEAWYIYYAEISEETRFAAFAFDNGSAPFEASRAVLDAMIATVNLDGD